jgi:hypothetical protein
LQDEISELRQKLKILSHQAEQLKEDITTKEAQLMKEENGNIRIVIPAFKMRDVIQRYSWSTYHEYISCGFIT